MLDINGAVEAEWPDEGVAAHYGDPVREQRGMAEGQVLVDRTNRGVVKVTGPDRLSWLHSLTSQHLERIAPGRTEQALVLSPQGHLEHHLSLTDDGAATWIHVEPHTAQALVGYLDSMRFMLRVTVEDLSGELGVLTLAGPLPADGGVISRTGAGGARPVMPGGDGGVAAVLDGPFGTDLIAAPDVAARLAAAYPVAGLWAFEAARIAARVPRPGLDTDHKTLPHEVGLIETAVHLNKGCYRGQETVARIHNLGHPPRRLVFLHLDGSVDRLPAHGAPLTHRRRHPGRLRRVGRQALRTRADRTRACQAVGGPGGHAARRRHRRRTRGDRRTGCGRQRDGDAAAGQRAAAACRAADVVIR